MDKLSELPVKNDTVKTEEESEIIKQFFQPEQTVSPPTNSPPTKSQSFLTSFISKINWKVVGIATLFFVILANPWIDKIFCKLPYCGENAASLLGIKTLIFFMVLIIISLYC